VWLLVYPQFRPFALLHDGSEAYIGDISRNLKTSHVMAQYRLLEASVQNAIWTRFGLNYTDDVHEHVKAADDLAAVFERAVIRDRRPFGEINDELTKAFETGFVSDARHELMLKLADRLPSNLEQRYTQLRKWECWSPAVARKIFEGELCSTLADGVTA
jgi:5'-deoxynucleotidase YfbR-like HD superfamily hydrolase